MASDPSRRSLGPRFARERVALEAMRTAAARLSVAPEELRASQYRALRGRARETNLPEDAAIRSTFGSWQRARERAATDG